MQNPSYSLLSSSNSHGLGSLSNPRGRAYCLGVAQPRLCGHIGLWYQPTVTAQSLDHVPQGGLGPPDRGEASSFIYLFILFTRTTASKHLVAINAEVIMW